MPYRVSTTSRFERLAKALRKQHPNEFTAAFKRVLAVLSTDPCNTARLHPIVKLVNARADEGLYRIRVGRFRFRYNVDGDQVTLVRCALRREDTYR